MTHSYNSCGIGPTHLWARTHKTIWTIWQVVGMAPFTHGGWAVMDDFGTLVEVPA